MLKKIIDIIKSDFQYYIFLLFVFAMPLTKKYLPFIMFLWVIVGIISIKKLKIDYYKRFIILVLPFLFYLIHIIGLIYSSNLRSGLFDLEVKLSIVFIPLVSFFINDKTKKGLKTILLLFVIGNLIASFICLSNSFLNSISINEFGKIIFNTSRWTDITDLNFFQLVNERYSYFSYAYFSILHHPSYFSMYILFSIVILVYLIVVNKKRNWVYYLLIVYFSFIVWLLASRAAYITYLIIFISIFSYIILKYKKYLLSIGAFIVTMIIILGVLLNTKINNNVSETLQIIGNKKSLTKDADIRLWLWKSGFEVFKENFWFGVGTGDIDDMLEKKYEEYNLKLAEEHHFNTHNQYLDSAVKLGVFGLGLLLLWILGSLIYAIKNKHFLLFFLSLIVLVNLFFESMLNTIAGVSFIAFFYSLLYSDAINKRKELN